MTKRLGARADEIPAERISEIRERVSAATAGTWTAERHDDSGYAVHARGGVIAMLHRSTAGKKRIAANAALIANAPADLLYLLRRLDQAETRARWLEDSVNRMCAERLLGE